MGIASHPVYLFLYLTQQCRFQIRKHGIQRLHAAGGGVPDIGIADEVDDLALLIAVQLPDQLVLDDLSRAQDALVVGTGGGGAVQNEDVLGVQLCDGLPGGILAVGGLFGIADGLAQIDAAQLRGQEVQLAPGVHDGHGVVVVHGQQDIVVLQNRVQSVDPGLEALEHGIDRCLPAEDGGAVRAF